MKTYFFDYVYFHTHKTHLTKAEEINDCKNNKMKECQRMLAQNSKLLFRISFVCGLLTQFFFGYKTKTGGREGDCHRHFENQDTSAPRCRCDTRQNWRDIKSAYLVVFLLLSPINNATKTIPGKLNREKKKKSSVVEAANYVALDCEELKLEPRGNPRIYMGDGTKIILCVPSRFWLQILLTQLQPHYNLRLNISHKQ